MRPLDVVYSRNQTPVEIGNTDAEGRLLLADALTYCQESKTKSDFILDFATLTGAAAPVKVAKSKIKSLFVLLS